MNDDVIQFDRIRRNAEETIEAVADMELREVIVIATTDDGVHIVASEGMDRLKAMGALLAGAIDRWGSD